MKTTRSIAKLLLACAFMMQTALAAEHHSGHGGAMGGGGGRSSCLKARLERFSPEPLATVPPDSAFSFYAFNVDSPEQISVTVKKIPVKFTSEYKDPFWVVRGQLPPSIDNTAARIDVKVKAKSPQCEAEKGWLIKISGRQ